MNIIEKKARKLVDLRLSDGRISDEKLFLKAVQDDLFNVDSESDKASYLTIILEANDRALYEHSKRCNIKSCRTEEKHETINYFLQQELKRLGIQITEDAFNRDEKESIVDYLDKVLSELKDLKDGHEIIYNDLKEEMDELKKLFILGKKNWRQIALGKFGEMIVGGVISEATAKPILETLKGTTSNLIG